MSNKNHKSPRAAHLIQTYNDQSDYPDCQRNRQRRRFTISGFLSGCIKRRRRTQRRESSDGFYTDWYSPRLRFMAISLILLSSCDAVFTMILLGKGATEINPIMAVLIGHDLLVFFYAKLMMTATPLILLVAHHNFKLFKRFRVENVITVSVIGYCILLIYELILLSSM